MTDQSIRARIARLEGGSGAESCLDCELRRLNDGPHNCPKGVGCRGHRLALADHIRALPVPVDKAGRAVHG
jgi:hypothetical protein